MPAEYIKTNDAPPPLPIVCPPSSNPPLPILRSSTPKQSELETTSIPQDQLE
jgi:hypothetical protein